MAEKGVGPIIDRSRVSSNTKWKGVQINANTLRFETSEHILKPSIFHSYGRRGVLMLASWLYVVFRLKSASNVSHGARRIVALACIHFVRTG